MRIAIVFLLPLALLSGKVQAAEPASGKVHSAAVKLAQAKKSSKRAGDLNHAPFSIFIPDGVTTIRGVIFNPYYEKTVEQNHWRTAAAHWDFALMGSNLFGINKSNIGQVTLDGLKAMAEKTGMPELATAPLCLVGMSAGGGMSTSITAMIPDRVIAAAPVCLEVGPTNEGSNNTPIVTIFGERDGKQMEKLSAKLPVARAENAQWAIAVQWSQKHEFHHAGNVIMPFFDAAIRERLPKDPPPQGEPPKLLPYPQEKSWLGAKEQWGEAPATIAPSSKAKGLDPKASCWFPDSYNAHVWQAFVIKTPKIKIVDPPGLGGGQKLIIHPENKPLQIETAISSDVDIDHIEIFLGDKPATTEKMNEYTFTLEKLPPGIHAVIAKGTNDKGQTYLSRPHTLLVR